MTSVAEPARELQPSSAFDPSSAWPRSANCLAWALVAIGAILRLGRFIHWRSLWLDELYLAQSILSRGYHDLLFNRLEHWQAAPAGFLVMTRLCVSLFGPGERSLRLTSFIFGMASLPLFLGVARRSLSPRGGLIALAFFATLGPLVYYSNELKQYSCDVTVFLAIVLAMMRWMQRPDDVLRLAVLAVTGAIGVFFSHPAILVLCGVGGIAIFLLWKSANVSAVQKLLAVTAIWAAAFVINYLLFIRPLASGDAHPHLVEYWSNRDAFMPVNPWYAAVWLFNRMWIICQDPGAMWLAFPDVALLAMITGFAALWLHQRTAAMLLLAALPVTLAASMARQYPFGDRLILFLVPALVILLAAGIDLLWQKTPRGIAGIATLLMLLTPAVSRDVNYFINPPGREETLQAYRWIAENWKPGDTLYISHYGQLAFDHYKPQVNWPSGPEQSGQVFVQPNLENNLPGFIQDVKRFAGRKRVWVIYDHMWDGHGQDEQIFTEMAFQQIGTKQPQYSHYEDGAQVFLYDCAKPTVQIHEAN